MREMPVSKAGEILGETIRNLWRALFAHVDAAWKDLSWENVVWVGADEMNRKKGHNYLTVFVDLQARRVCWPWRAKTPAPGNALRSNCLSTTASQSDHPNRHRHEPGVSEKGCGRIRQRASDSCSTISMWSARWSRRWRKCAARKPQECAGTRAVAEILRTPF